MSNVSCSDDSVVALRSQNHGLSCQNSISQGSIGSGGVALVVGLCPIQYLFEEFPGFGLVLFVSFVFPRLEQLGDGLGVWWGLQFLQGGVPGGGVGRSRQAIEPVSSFVGWV
jgi:hypothetical protein